MISCLYQSVELTAKPDSDNMAAVVLRSQFFDDYGIQYSIVIYDKDSTSTDPSEQVDTVKGSIIVTDEGDDKNPFKRIIPKKMSWTIIMHNPAYTTAQRNAAISFYENLTGSPEGRFYVTLLSVIDFTPKVIFRGKILADVGDLTLTYHRELNLTATDGILQLKDIDYRPVDYNDEVPEDLINFITFKNHFTDLLGRNDVVDFFYKNPLGIDTGTAMFTTSTHWNESVVDPDGDIFASVAKKNTYFEQKEKQRYRKYTNCFDALQDLITGFNCRLIFSDGAYHIEALGYQDNLTLVRYAYDETGTLLTSPGNKVTHDITTDDDIYMMPTPSLVHIAPLKAVILKQNKKYNNILSGINMWWHRTDTDNRGPHNFGYVIGAGNQLVFDIRLQLTVVTPFVLYRYMQFEFEIKLGDYYLKNNPITGNVKQGNIPMEFLWTLTPSTFIMIMPAPLTFFIPSFQDGTFLTGLSDEIPVDDEFFFRLVDWKALNDTFVEVPAQTAKFIEMRLHHNSRVFATTNGAEGLNKVPDNTIIYEIGDTKNSIVYEEKLSYHDAPVEGISFNSLLLLLDGISFKTISWTDPDDGITKPIDELLMNQMLAMRAKPNKVVRCTLERQDRVRMFIDDRYALGSSLYIPLRMIHNIDQGSYSMSLWSPVKDYDGINIDRYKEDDIVEYNILLAASESGRIVSTPVTYYNKFTVVNDTYITTTENLDFYVTSSMTPEKIDELWTVIVNGITNSYKDATGMTFPLTGGELDMGQYTIDVDNNRFYFAFNDNATIILKYFKP